MLGNSHLDLSPLRQASLHIGFRVSLASSSRQTHPSGSTVSPKVEPHRQVKDVVAVGLIERVGMGNTPRAMSRIRTPHGTS